MNKIWLIGNLIKDPIMRSTPNGVTVCEFTIAVNRRDWKSEERTKDLYTINAWRSLGDICDRYLAKGKKVAVIGELRASTYVGKEGITHIRLDVNASEVEFLSPKNEEPKVEEPEAESHPMQDGFTDITSDDIPF